MTSVWSWQPDGRVSVVSPAGDEGMWYQACIHPDGGHAVFWGGAYADPGRVWRASTAGDDPAEPLTSGPLAARHPAYGARGDRIVFTAGPPRPMGEETPAGAPSGDEPWHLFSMAPDGTDVRQVTDGDAVDQRPALSPDGATVAFVSSRGPGIWLAPADGTAPPRAIGDLPLYRPWWSVDGSAIYCFVLRAENRQVGRLDVATGVWSPLPNDAAGNTHGPYADLRGDRLLCHSDRDGQYALWEIPLDGSPMVKVTPPGFEDGRPHGHGTRARTGEVTFDAATLPPGTGRQV